MYYTARISYTYDRGAIYYVAPAACRMSYDPETREFSHMAYTGEAV